MFFGCSAILQYTPFSHWTVSTLCNIKHPSAFKSKNPDDICQLSLLTRECTRSVIAYLFLCKCIYGHNHGRSQGNALDAEDKWCPLSRPQILLWLPKEKNTIPATYEVFFCRILFLLLPCVLSNCVIVKLGKYIFDFHLAISFEIQGDSLSSSPAPWLGWHKIGAGHSPRPSVSGDVTPDPQIREKCDNAG